MASQQQQESKTIPLKILVDKHSNKVVFVEANKDFVETLFSFLSLPLATIVCLLDTTNNIDQQQQPQSESSQFLGRIINLCKYFVETLFSFLSFTLTTINRILATYNNDQQQFSESSPFLGSINKLYQSVQNTSLNDVWNNPVCKQMLLHPRNPCEALCLNLFLNVDDTVPSSKFFCV
ncbi:hypothetical protein P8452_35567 [Trifolium repens]|jgi:hypothetical protein|nr:hypothetical protein P8452_35567 [Trifolium repens]